MNNIFGEIDFRKNEAVQVFSNFNIVFGIGYTRHRMAQDTDSVLRQRFR